MLQQIIDFLYRKPKGHFITYERFGGYWAYHKMQKAHIEMQKASYLIEPITYEEDGLPLYFLTGKKYIHQTLFCLLSLSKVTNERFCVHLIDDGSFDEQLINRIRTQLPGAIIVDQSQIEHYINNKLPFDRFPILHRKRLEYPHIKKLTDVHLYPSDSPFKVVLDSDMLFWNNPTDLIDWLKWPMQALHMIDCGEAYGYPHAALEKLAQVTVPHLVNVGIVGLKSDQINWDQVETWIDSLEQEYGKSYYLEQALSAVLIGAHEAKQLGAGKYIVNPVKFQTEAVLHHYVDLSKKIYYTEAWKSLI